MRDSEVTKKEADKLNSPITQEDDGAQGLDNVRITYVKEASNTT